MTLKRLARPGDSTGVADLIHSRVAAGDLGTPAESSGFASGWFGESALPWIPWIGAGLVLAVAGTALGFSGALAGSPEPGPAVFFATETVSAGFCPGDTGAATFAAGERVLAIARSEDSAHLAVRDPFTHSTTVWLPADVVNVDAGEADIATLPVSGCLVPVVTAETAEPAPPPPPAPTPTKDTTAPTLANASGDPVACGPALTYPETTVISVFASDNVAVDGVSITWTGEETGAAEMMKSGSTWSFTYDPDGNVDGDVDFTLIAHDAAGNTSQPAHLTILVNCFG